MLYFIYVLKYNFLFIVLIFGTTLTFCEYLSKEFNKLGMVWKQHTSRTLKWEIFCKKRRTKVENNEDKNIQLFK